MYYRRNQTIYNSHPVCHLLKRFSLVNKRSSLLSSHIGIRITYDGTSINVFLPFLFYNTTTVIELKYTLSISLIIN